MASRARVAPAATLIQNGLLPQALSRCSALWRNPLPAVEAILKRDEADILFVAGNVILVGLEIIEWPVALVALAVHGMARSRFKALQVVSEVAEEGEG
jgi:hypothetical protein